jgi:uncharacterized membrane protein YkoI
MTMRLKFFVLVPALLLAAGLTAKPSSVPADASHQLEYPFMAKVSLLQAVEKAEAAVPGGRANSVYLLLDKDDKTLKYFVWVATKDLHQSTVTVDPADGAVLDVSSGEGKK